MIYYLSNYNIFKALLLNFIYIYTTDKCPEPEQRKS